MPGRFTIDPSAGGHATPPQSSGRPGSCEPRDWVPLGADRHVVNGMSTVFVVDDDDDVRATIRRLVASVHLRVETYASAAQFLEVYNGSGGAGCVITDVRLPGMSGLDLQAELAARKSTLPIIMITGYADVATAVRALRAGAFDFLEKPVSSQLLLDRVQEALERDKRLRQLEADQADVMARVGSLTPREREVMQHVVAGATNKAIALDLSLSEKTVEVHRGNLMRKMRAGSVAQLVRMALLATGTRADPSR